MFLHFGDPEAQFAKFGFNIFAVRLSILASEFVHSLFQLLSLKNLTAYPVHDSICKSVRGGHCTYCCLRSDL